MLSSIRNLMILPRYLKDPQVPRLNKLLIFLPFIYFISPFDLFPEMIFSVFGYLEDLGVVIVGWQMIMRELERYRLDGQGENPKEDPSKVVNLHDDDIEIK